LSARADGNHSTAEETPGRRGLPDRRPCAECVGYAAYGAVGIAALPIGLAVAGIGAAVRPRWRPGFLERLGKLPDGLEKAREKPVRLWVHCASIGEVRAAHPLLDAISRQRPDAGMLLTTTTPEGNRTARSLGLAQSVGMLPADLPGLPGRIFDALEPDALVLLS
jgi:3-deoxy-D-manno-octulosonic-acid transferase